MPGIRALQLIKASLLAMAFFMLTAQSSATAQLKFKRIPTQFIAALGEHGAASGNGAQSWGLWRRDPGPRGVWLRLFPILKAAGGYAPTGWKFDATDWWLDENGLIMEQPDFPVAPGRYLVTGGREVTTVLTVHPKGENGDQRWELANGATLNDVTHLACRSARYTPKTENRLCLPSDANPANFRVEPGASMPSVDGCNKQDYSVLFVVGLEVK